nr:hybrid signal transduction histidine kinase M [Tanacetum cinerariifolium]
IFSILSDTLQAVGCGTSIIRQGRMGSNYRHFQNNKRSRTIALKAKSRSLKPGDLSIDAYFRKIESIATILTSLGSPISSEDIVTFTLED